VSDPVLLVEKDGGIATVTLNRPRAMNALSRELRRALLEAFRGLSADRETRVVILTGAGERAFCAGLDLKELAGEVGGEGSGSAAEAAVSGGGDLVAEIEGIGCPVIGAINGVAITGGFELALACDVLVGSTNARFADTHARVGILPGWGLSQKLPRLIGVYRAKELSLTGNFIDAEQSERWGLLNRVVPPEALLATCRSLAEDMLSCEPDMVPAYKRIIDEGFAETLGEGRRLEAEANRAHASGVTAEGVRQRRLRVMERGRRQGTR
jgi:enoyl-CoA hydratase